MGELLRPEFGSPSQKSKAAEQADMYLQSQQTEVKYENQDDNEFIQTRGKLETEQGVVLYDFKDAADLAVLHSVVNRDDLVLFKKAEELPGEKKTSERVLLNRFDANILQGHVGALNPSDARILGAVMRRLRPNDMVYVIASEKEQGQIKVREKYSKASEWQAAINSGDIKNDAERGQVLQQRLAELF